jgi:hypothetical protein
VVAAGVLAMPVSLLLERGPVPTRTAPSSTAAGPVAAARPACGDEPRDAAGWSSLFGSLDGDWAGGDGSSSTRLPDGRVLWLFGDTVTGSTGPDGRRSGTVGLVHNSVLITTGTCVTSLASRVDALPGDATTWLWPTHAVVTRAGRPGSPSSVVVLAQRVARTGNGAFDFRRVSTVVVELVVAWSGPARVGRVRDVAGPDVLWGAAVLTQGSTTWVYGTRDAGPGTFGRDLLLARAPTRSAGDRSTWRYRTRDGWARSASRAVVVRRSTDGVSTVLSGAMLGGRPVLVTKPQEFLDDRVVELSAPRPWGPWTQRTLLLAPSTATRPQYSPALVVGADRHRAVVVVNRTSTSLTTLLTDSSAARPTFYDVDLAG